MRGREGQAPLLHFEDHGEAFDPYPKSNEKPLKGGGQSPGLQFGQRPAAMSTDKLLPKTCFREAGKQSAVHPQPPSLPIEKHLPRLGRALSIPASPWEPGSWPCTRRTLPLVGRRSYFEAQA